MIFKISDRFGVSLPHFVLRRMLPALALSNFVGCADFVESVDCVDDTPRSSSSLWDSVPMFRFTRFIFAAWITLVCVVARIEADDESILWSDGPNECSMCRSDDHCDTSKACRPCCCLTDDRFWFRGEALLWWTDGMHTPPLISASPPGTALADAGVLGTPGATVLFGGNERLLNSPHVGWRLQGGGWLDCDKQVGFEGD